MAYCVNCGKELKETDNFCSSCGIQKNTAKEDSKKVMKCFMVFGNVGYALSIVTMVLAFIPIWNFMSWVVGVHGIVFSCLGKRDESQLAKCKKGLRRSIIGSILGFILFVLFIVIIIIIENS